MSSFSFETKTLALTYLFLVFKKSSISYILKKKNPPHLMRIDSTLLTSKFSVIYEIRHLPWFLPCQLPLASVGLPGRGLHKLERFHASCLSSFSDSLVFEVHLDTYCNTQFINSFSVCFSPSSGVGEDVKRAAVSPVLIWLSSSYTSAM